MTTETTTTAPTKAEMYDEIGKINIDIVINDEQILALENNLDQLVDEPEFQIGTQQSLREHRILKANLDAEVKRIRRTILGRLEIEAENMEKKSETEPLKEKISLLSAVSQLKKEIETLKLLTAV